MTTTSDQSLTLTLTFPAGLTHLLRANVSDNFMSEQPGRFLPLGRGSLPSPDASEFRGGTLMWTDCVADALLLRACEEAAGEIVTLLCDEYDLDTCGVVVLSSRPFFHGRSTDPATSQIAPPAA